MPIENQSPDEWPDANAPWPASSLRRASQPKPPIDPVMTIVLMAILLVAIGGFWALSSLFKSRVENDAETSGATDTEAAPSAARIVVRKFELRHLRQTNATLGTMYLSTPDSDTRVEQSGMLRFSITVAVLTSIAVTCSLPVASSAQEPATALHELARPYFSMGVGVGARTIASPQDQRLITSQFDYVTPENCMKVQRVQRIEGQFRFEAADRFVRFATDHERKIVGHCLVWAKDDRTPAWFFKDGDQDASAELVLSRMKIHIETLVKRYRGQVAMWDVVNEALADGSGEYLRDSGWTRATGEDFIVKAFEYARAADPDAFLIYNDYRCDTPGKRAKLLRLARMLKERNAPVDAIGLQGHYELDSIPYEGLEAMFQELRELGFKIVVSELDIDVVKRGRWWADGGRHREELASYDPYKEGCPPEVLKRQAEQYARLFELFVKYSDVVERVSFWNLHDGQSWLNNFPWRRANHPLLFDRARQPKPAFHAVVEVLQQRARRD